MWTTENRKRYDRSQLRYPSDLTDAEWAYASQHNLSGRTLSKDRTGLRYVDHLEGDGSTIFEHACKPGLEGIVSKRVDLPYEAGPSKSWQKTKNKEHPAIKRVREAFERERARRRY